MNRETAIEKIQKLLARADADRNDNDHEREIALRQANALMAKHELSSIDLTESEQRKELGDLTESDDPIGTSLWLATIYSAIAKMNNCQAIRSPHNKTIHILGHSSKVAITRDLSAYCIRSIKREMPNAWNGFIGKANESKRSFNTSFGNGAANAIYSNVREIIRARNNGNINGEQLSSSQAMILVDIHKKQLAEVNAFFKKAYPSTRKGSGSRSYSNAGYSAGKSFGSGLSLNNQLGRRSAGLLN